MKQISELRIFLGSPGDVEVERTIVKEVVDELNITYGTPNNIVLKLVNWENYSYPGFGEDPQEVIINQLPFDFDVFLCIFWTRIGTPTKRAASGTIEELNIAIEKKTNGEDIEIMGYFKTEPPSSLKDITEQYFEVQKLQKDFGKNGLYKEFTSTDKFKEVFRINFTNFLNNKFSNFPKSTAILPAAKTKLEVGNKKRNEIYAKLASLNLDVAVSEDMVDTMEILSDKSHEIAVVLGDISGTMNELTSKVNVKAGELKSLNNISDYRLKMKKKKIVVNQLANELDVISDKYEVYVPDFKEHYHDLVDSFIKIYSQYEHYMSEGDKLAKTDLLENIDNASEALTDLLVEMDKVPKLTSKYGQATIRQMKILKELVEEILFGRELLDQIE